MALHQTTFGFTDEEGPAEPNKPLWSKLLNQIDWKLLMVFKLKLPYIYVYLYVFVMCNNN